MPPIYGDTSTATDIEGKTMQEVSKSLSLSISAMKSRASCGRGMLEELMMDRCSVEITQSGDVEYAPAAMGRCGERGCGWFEDVLRNHTTRKVASPGWRSSNVVAVALA
ncbi:MAG: hypothetical protein FJX66_15215 [Alphaproteobacteria bacterium]|nr:hypothetical protein [Alphaproteobacteria bacterium]